MDGSVHIDVEGKLQDAVVRVRMDEWGGDASKVCTTQRNVSALGCMMRGGGETWHVGSRGYM